MNSLTRLRASLSGRIKLLLILGCLASLLAAPSAVAAPSHVLDAELSLTGGCTTSALDPVPDPGCSGGVHPGSFSIPFAVTTDSYGDIYVSTQGSKRIDIFNAEGVYLTSIDDSTPHRNLAVDSDGYLYSTVPAPEETLQLVRYKPVEWEPVTGAIEYESPPTVIGQTKFQFSMGLAVNPLNDHLFADTGSSVYEYSSAAEGNNVLDEAVVSTPGGPGSALTLDAAHNRLYVGALGPSLQIFELGAPHALIGTIDGSETPKGEISTENFSVAADEDTGHFFIYDGNAKEVTEFDLAGTYLESIKFPFVLFPGSEIAVDNGEESPNGKHNTQGRYLFVPSHFSGVGHSFAFGPPAERAPEVSAASFTGVTENEADLRASINPGQLETTFVFEIEAVGSASSVVVGEGQLPAGSVDVPVAAGADGLAPETNYRFRVVATNQEGSDSAEGEFTTYPAQALEPFPCGNGAVRSGTSMLLPDCRAYELVTPSDTNARVPFGQSHLGSYFATQESSPGGDKVSFLIEGGSLPGFEGTGSKGGDPYLASRGANGWSTVSAGPNGTEAIALRTGSSTPDKGFSFWGALSEGSAVIEGKDTNYVRFPDGHSELVGQGSLGSDPGAEGKLISENSAHILFASTAQLEPNAPNSGTNAIYDRTLDGTTHVVSLLPGNLPQMTGQTADYRGSSLDGKGVAFSIGNMLYLRYENSETFEVGEGVQYSGIAEGGNQIFYLSGGQLLRFDALTGQTTAFNSTGAVTPVNVSSDGSAAYFVSTSALTTQANPVGLQAEPGEQNLYLSREGAISFVGIVTKRDVEGESGGNELVEGLGLWTTAVGKSAFGNAGRLAEDPSRTTPDGVVLLFEARANLTGYDSKGHVQVYRYDSGADKLSCLSCNPTGAEPTGSASLESISQQIAEAAPLNSFDVVANLRADGRRAFFQSTEALVPADTDGLQDVYEWEEQGVGTCERLQGCLYLITSGGSDEDDYLYAVSDSGDDVFFRTSDLLLPTDSDETPSIYDARVGGGFPEAHAGACQGEGCRPGLSPPSLLPSPGMQPNRESGNVVTCPKGKRKVKRHGSVRCVKKRKRHHKHHHHGTGTQAEGGRK